MGTPNNKLLPRPPVVAVVGHVDHGKTALLDHIRKTNVVDREAGGITQSIGAYEVEHAGHKITFIDTPGHEAFTTMRSNGASAADIAVLVIAADEGIKQQTKEVLGILRALQTPFVVAITKLDKENADVEKVKGDLTAEEVFLEGSGGDVSWQTVSAKTGEGVSELLDHILLMGEVLGLKYDPTAAARGFVIESTKDPRRGNVSHLILKDGTLRQGDDIKTASASGKARMLENFLGESVKELVPSAPASVVGFDEFPVSGEAFVTGNADLGDNHEIVEAVAASEEEQDADKPNAIIKADTRGSLEALVVIMKPEVVIKGASVGDITDSDVKLARSTNSIIVGFGTKIAKAAINLAEAQSVPVFTSAIIYELLDAIREQKSKKKQEFEGGELEVLATFNSTVSKQTVGGKVLRGSMKPNMPVTIEREGEPVGKGRVKSIEQDKENVKEVGPDNECGLVIETSVEIKNGDILKLA